MASPSRLPPNLTTNAKSASFSECDLLPSIEVIVHFSEAVHQSFGGFLSFLGRDCRAASSLLDFAAGAVLHHCWWTSKLRSLTLAGVDSRNFASLIRNRGMPQIWPTGKRKRQRPPLLAITLVRKVMDVSSISVNELCRRIYSGVLINENKLKFWVDLDCGKNCFLLLAKSIHGIDENGGNWTWIDAKEKCYEGEVSIQVAEMASVRWPELSATFKTIMLSPNTAYDVAFVVNVREDSERLHGRLNLSLTLPDGTRLGRTEDLESRAEGIWIQILVSTFVTTPQNVGEITINCTLSDGWTKELIVKGIELRPQRT